MSGRRSYLPYPAELPGFGEGGGGGNVIAVTGTAPSVITGTPTNPNVTITPATEAAAGSMSAADKTKLDGLVVTNVVIKPGVAASGNVYPTYAAMVAALPAGLNGILNVTWDDTITS